MGARLCHARSNQPALSTHICRMDLDMMGDSCPLQNSSQAAAASAGRAARRAGRLQGLLQQVRSQVCWCSLLRGTSSSVRRFRQAYDVPVVSKSPYCTRVETF